MRKASLASRKSVLYVLSVCALALVGALFLLARGRSPSARTAQPNEPIGNQGEGRGRPPVPDSDSAHRLSQDSYGEGDVFDAELEQADSPQEVSPALQPWQELRQQELDRLWRNLEVARANKNVTVNEVSAAIQIALRPVLDEMNLGQEVSRGSGPLLQPEGAHYMSTGNREYHVPVGLFPVLDDFMRRWEEYHQGPSASGLPEGSNAATFPVDDVFLGDVRDLIEDAKRTIARREDAY